MYVGGEPASIEALPGRVSNRAVQVTWSNGGAWVLKQALEKLRMKEDWSWSVVRKEFMWRRTLWLNRMGSSRDDSLLPL
jgi:hypothetical protein